MGKILIIGAGFGQVPAIKKAKKMGLETICIDRDPDAPGMSIADVSYAVDIIDKEAALKIAEIHEVSGVLTLQSDLPVPTVGYINDHLGLQGVSFEVANACSNKVEARNRLQKNRCSQPDYKIVKDRSEAEVAADETGYPCVIKAPDSSGSRGIVKVNNRAEVKEAFKEAEQFSRSNQILVEEYIDGLEFGAQTFSVNGSCERVLLHNDTLSEPPYMIPIGHSMPFRFLSDEEREVAVLDIKKAVEALGIKNGPANVDLILDKNTNRVKIIEIGARIGATCLPELVTYHTGIDWVHEAINSCISEEVDLTVKKNIPVAAVIVEAPKDGVFKGFDQKNFEKNEFLLELEITAKEGDKVNLLRKGTDRIGKVLATGEDVLEAEKNAKRIREQIKIDVQ
jgi:biotin carboxylase